MVDAKTEFECTWNFLVWIGSTRFQNFQGGNKMKSVPMTEIIENLPHIPHHLTPIPRYFCIDAAAEYFSGIEY